VWPWKIIQITTRKLIYSVLASTFDKNPGFIEKGSRQVKCRFFQTKQFLFVLNRLFNWKCQFLGVKISPDATVKYATHLAAAWKSHFWGVISNLRAKQEKIGGIVFWKIQPV
jgi:hypothetical protein